MNPNDEKNTIVGFDRNVIQVVTNGTMEEIIDGNYLFAGTGKVVKADSEEVISEEITPMIMLINQGGEDKINTLREYIEGNDTKYNEEFNRTINYFGRETSAREIAIKCRNY